jgi:hypothetical protein
MKKSAQQNTKHEASRLTIHRETLQKLSASKIDNVATGPQQCHSGEHSLCSIC